MEKYCQNCGYICHCGENCEKNYAKNLSGEEIYAQIRCKF